MSKSNHLDPETRQGLNRAAMDGRKLIFEKDGEPLSVASVYFALEEIHKSRSLRCLPYSRQAFPDRLLCRENFEEVDLPPEDAIRVITRALREGEKGKKILKAALELKPPAKGAILARYIANELTIPEGGWPSKDDEERWQDVVSDKVKWQKPTKRQVERELEKRYPEIYERLSKKDGNGGKLLRSNFWDDAGLKEVIDQSRG
ncbi:hypothetical protein HZ994_12805 [Akkermansiaceae bacterium]|nr:hypothetical protein HZ994_12805 [Akkermansiaceae bacterium]